MFSFVSLKCVAQWRGIHIGYKVFPLIIQVLSSTIYYHNSIVNSIPCAVPYIYLFCNYQLVLLNPITLFLKILFIYF